MLERVSVCFVLIKQTRRGRAMQSVSQSVGLHSNLLSSHAAKILKTIFTSFWHDAQHKRDSVEKKVAVSPVVPLNKAINKIPRSLCGR